MKVVKNKTLKKDPAKRRGTYNDSPLRYPMNVHMTDTHERRISWLYYENYQICNEYISAQILYAIAKLKRKEKETDLINLKTYKAVKDALALWRKNNFDGGLYYGNWIDSMEDTYRYHYVGDEEEDD